MDYDNPQYLGWYIIPYKNYQPTRVLNTAKVATTVWGNGSEKLSQGAPDQWISGYPWENDHQKPCFVHLCPIISQTLSGFKFPTNPMISSSNLVDLTVGFPSILIQVSESSSSSSSLSMSSTSAMAKRNKWLG